MNIHRVRKLNSSQTLARGPVVYWMSRDQRVHDNWALLHAQELAIKNSVSLVVVFALVPQFLGATERQYDFMLRGLSEVSETLQSYGIPFTVLLGDPVEEISRFVTDQDVSAVVVDFSPLKVGREWREGVASKITVPFFEVDAHNIIPAWVTSPKQEFGAYTIRPKVYKHLPNFLEPFPQLVAQERVETFTPVDWSALRQKLSWDTRVPAVDWITPGECAAVRHWEEFQSEGLSRYGEERNFPDKQGQSDLSPYLHFGHICAQRIVLDLDEWLFKRSKQSVLDMMHKEKNGSTGEESISAFLEELVVRRELADNFCLYNSHYDAVAGFPAWAQKTVQKHRLDAREVVYTRDELEQGKTHDDLWNASQMEMVKRGKMHGYMRMYWAKKILEWTNSPEEAMSVAIYLNDRYELDGRDPNGYTGIAWSMGGVHDRAWFERPIFGKIRYMNYNGAKNEFDIGAYIAYVHSL